MIRCVMILILLAFGVAGCDNAAGLAKQSPSHAKPIATGEVVHGTIWDKPVTNPQNNTGNPIEAGSRVEIYEQFIIVTSRAGEAEIAPHGWYTDLRFKPE